jgi:hypothetical protein
MDLMSEAQAITIETQRLLKKLCALCVSVVNNIGTKTMAENGVLKLNTAGEKRAGQSRLGNSDC